MTHTIAPVVIIDYGNRYITVSDGTLHYLDTFESYALDAPVGAPALEFFDKGADVYVPGVRNSMHIDGSQTEGRMMDAYHENILKACAGLVHNRILRLAPIAPTPIKPRWWQRLLGVG